MQLGKIVIIIINYRTGHLLQELLDSIQEPEVPCEVVILDNASTDESMRPLQQLRYNGLHLLRDHRNLGFTGGINKVLDYISDKLPNAPYFFLLNPDAQMTPGLLGRLQALLQQHPTAACISPRILNQQGTAWYSGARFQFKKGVVTTSTNHEEGECMEVDVFSGCAALFDRNKAMAAGRFNEGLFMYYDEADFSLKLRNKGFKVLYAPNLVVHHDVSYTTRNITHLKSYYMTRNKFIVFHKTMSPFAKAYYLTHELAFYLKNRKLKNAVYHLKGYLDFRMGKSGPIHP